MKMRYGVTADEAHRFGLPCGGTIELLVEFNPDVDALLALISRLEGGELVSRITDLKNGQVRLEKQTSPAGLVCDAQHLANTFGPEYRLLIIGAGQLAEYLSTMAHFCGFAVTVCDPREEYTSAWSVAQARLTREMPDDAVRLFHPDHRSAVVAVSHDPKLDDLALLEALNTEAFYVGAIGSRRNNAARRQRMVEHFDVAPAWLDRLRGPIGLYIGSKTPPEIAVSIMAEILAAKNAVTLPPGSSVLAAKEALVAPQRSASESACGQP